MAMWDVQGHREMLLDEALCMFATCWDEMSIESSDLETSGHLIWSDVLLHVCLFLLLFVSSSITIRSPYLEAHLAGAFSCSTW